MPTLSSFTAGEAHVASGHVKAAMARLPGLLAGSPQIVHADAPADGWSRMAELQPAND
jgi:hypothetical protein